MDLIDLVSRQIPPEPWKEGENIPWNDPDFSQRILHEHLSQEHDAASRRFPTVDQHVGWLHCTVLEEQPSRILDLGCGPGFYTSRLATLGHTCLGIDYSPASIRYARDFALQRQLDCQYIEQDLRRAEYGQGYDLVMQIYGEFNTFSCNDAALVLEKARQALKPGGKLLLEAHTYDTIYRIGNDPCKWSAIKSGLFSDRPHLLLEERFWDAQLCTATRRFFVIDAASSEVTRFAASYQAYTVEEYRRMIQDHGYEDIRVILDLSGGLQEGPQDFIALLASKG